MVNQIHSSVKEAKGSVDSKEQQDILVKSALNKIKSKFLVMSGKGGVGKTTTTVNISLSLANFGYKVGILDVDLHGPDIPRMLGLKGKLEINSNNQLKPMQYNKNLSVVSVEAIMPSKDDAIIWRGPMKYSAIQQFIGNVNWEDLDFLIVDAPPGTGDEPLTIAQTISDAKAIIVTTSQEIALADVRKSINFCKTLKMNIFGLIENMSSFICGNCKNKIDLFGSGGGEKNSFRNGSTFSC